MKNKYFGCQSYHITTFDSESPFPSKLGHPTVWVQERLLYSYSISFIFLWPTGANRKQITRHELQSISKQKEPEDVDLLLTLCLRVMLRFVSVLCLQPSNLFIFHVSTAATGCRLGFLPTGFAQGIPQEEGRTRCLTPVCSTDT